VIKIELWLENSTYNKTHSSGLGRNFPQIRKETGLVKVSLKLIS